MTKKEAERSLCRKIDLRTKAGKADFMEACRRERETRRRINDEKLREKLHAGPWYVVDSDQGGILLTAVNGSDSVFVSNEAHEDGVTRVYIVYGRDEIPSYYHTTEAFISGKWNLKAGDCNKTGEKLATIEGDYITFWRAGRSIVICLNRGN